MKKAFAVATLTVWSLGLLIGLGFGVVGLVNATGKLPLENRQLLAENRSLATKVGLERGRSDQYLAVFNLQSKMLYESATLPEVASSGPWPREE